MNTAMTTHNFGERPEAAGGAKGEVVTPQASEFQTLKLLVKQQLKDVEIEEKEDKIIVRKEDLEITIENWRGDYDYWVWEINVSNELGKANIYISSAEQTFDLVAYPKNTKVEMNNKIKNERVEEDLYICTQADIALDEIKEIINSYEEYGLAGMYYYFAEFLEPELSFLEP